MAFRQSLLPTALVVALLVTGCSLVLLRCGRRDSPSGPQIGSYEMLKPDKLALTKCTLELAGTKFNADITQVRTGPLLKLELRAFGNVIETERYESTDEAFSLVEAAGEQFDPPIVLIKYPMHIGDKWTWSGTIKSGHEPRAATAEVITSSENMTISGGTVPNVVREDVVLSIGGSQTGASSMRKLSFWIAPDMGVVQREFGDYSSREPLGN